ERHVRGVVIGIVKCLRVGIGDSVLEAARVPPADLYLQSVIVRRAGIRDRVDVAVTLVGTKEAIVLGAVPAKGVPLLRMQIQESRGIGNTIYVSPLPQMPA